MSRIYEALKKAEQERAISLQFAQAKPATNSMVDLNRATTMPLMHSDIAIAGANREAWPADWFRQNAGI
jgi:hypothetical protein